MGNIQHATCLGSYACRVRVGFEWSASEAGVYLEAM